MEPIASTATLTPTTQRQGVKVQTRPFKITDIPDAMDKMNWPVAAALMRHWFNGKPWPDTADGGMSYEVKNHILLAPEEYIEDSIVTMEWALKFERVREAISLLRGKWGSANAQIRLKQLFDRKPGFQGIGRYQLRFNGSAKSVEEFGYTNQVPVEFSGLDFLSIDELRGGFG